MASDTDALQRAYRLANIVERYIVCDARSSYFRRDNESDFSALEFFVELHCAHDLVSWKILRQTRRQIKLLQKVDHRIALPGRESGSFDRDRARGDNPEAERFTMKKFPVISRTLNRVTNGVSEIEKRSFCRFNLARLSPRFSI